MTREIKFRVRGTSGDRLWFYWNAATIHKPGCAISWELHDWDTMSQYTGLKDRHGVEIYEGDIIEWQNSYTHEVPKKTLTGVIEWDVGCLAIFDKLEDTWANNSDWYGAITELNVIGNIYENPELLK